MSKKMDVLVVTYNNSRTLRSCLSHIKDNLPHNNILVGDGGSSDNTLEVARSMGAQVYSFTGNDNMIGRIRYKLAEKAETDWVVYVDSDDYVYPSFWKVVSKYAKAGVGMVMAITDSPSGNNRKYIDWVIRRLGFVTFSNTLAPRRLILECEKLLSMHTCEDTVYESFVREKGYQIVKIYEPLSFHDKPSVLGVAFRRDGRELGQKRALFGLLWKEAFHLRNLLWFSFEKRVSSIEILEYSIYAWVICQGFVEGLKGLK